MQILSDESFKTIKQRRRTLSQQSKEILNRWLTEHIAHPFPSVEEKQQLCDATGTTLEQVTVWFVNARARKAAQSQAQLDSASAGNVVESESEKSDAAPLTLSKRKRARRAQCFAWKSQRRILYFPTINTTSYI